MNSDAPNPHGRLAPDQRIYDLEKLIQVESLINRSLDPEKIYQTSLNGIFEVLGAGFGCFVLLNPDSHTLELGQNLNLESTLRVCLEEFIHDFDFESDIAYPDDHDYAVMKLGERIGAILENQGIKNTVFIPLLTQSQLVGILLFGIGSGKFLAPRSIDLLMSIGDQVAYAIENARLHTALKESEAWSRTFIGDSPDAFWEANLEGKILYVNDSACKIIGADRATILKMNREDFFIISPENRILGRRLIEEKGVWTNQHAHLRNMDGQIKDISITIRGVRDDSGVVTRFQSVFRDVTEQTVILETLQQRNEELKALNSIASILANPLEIEHALDQVCEVIISITGMEGIGLYSKDEAGQYLNLLAQRGMSESLLKQARVLGLDDPAARMVAIEGKALALNDLADFGAPQSFLGPRQEGYHAGLCIPIERRGAPVGAIFVGSKTKNTFDQSDVNLILNIGRQIGTALENADLYARMKQRVSELDGLAKLSAACTASLDAQVVADSAIEWTLKLLDTDIAELCILQGDQFYPISTKTNLAQIRLSRSLCASDLWQSVSEPQNPIIINDLTIDVSPTARQRFEMHGLRSALIMQLSVQGKILGTISVAREQPYQWSTNEIDLLRTIANQVGSAMQNADLYRQMQQRVKELDGLAKLGMACSATLDPLALSETTVESAKKLLGTDFAIIRLLENNTMRLAASRTPPSVQLQQDIQVDNVFGSTVHQLTTMVVHNIAASNLPSLHRENFLRVGMGSIVIVPMTARDQPIGTMAIAYQTPHVWEPHEIDLLRTIAHQVSTSIDSARLFQNVLREEQKIQAIFDSGLSGLFVTDAQGHIVMFNKAAELMTGWSFDQVRDRIWDELFSDPSAETDAKSLIKQALAKKRTIFAHGGRKIRTFDGHSFPAAKAVAPLFDEQGKVTGVVGAFWDLTREQAAEQEREDFLRLVAHQMSSPLAALLGALQLLQKPNLSEKRRREMWAIVQSDGERLRRFASQFLQLEATVKSEQAIELKPIAIAPMVHELVKKYKINKTHQFNLSIVKPEPLVYANAERLEHVLRNLIDNAVTYSPKNTQIIVTVQTMDNDRVLIEVKDEGPGIPNDEQAKIFRSFYRSPRDLARHTTGHGLGLAIAQRMVKEMNGEIMLESEEGHGATFFFTLRRHP